ncbi:MAG: lipoprotein [Bdellovibrionota bacterium]
MKKLIYLALATLLLTSCATAYRNEGGPVGKESYVIECEQETNACFEKAKEVCKSGYVTTNISAVGATTLLFFAAQLRTIEVYCK